MLNELLILERWKIWWRGGCYIRNHAWQLFFAVDSRRAFRQGLPVGAGHYRWLNFLEPIYNFLTDNLLGRLCATVLLRSWFEMTDLWLSRKEKKELS